MRYISTSKQVLAHVFCSKYVFLIKKKFIFSLFHVFRQLSLVFKFFNHFNNGQQNILFQMNLVFWCYKGYTFNAF